jgi:hypothetical protein
MEVDFHSPVKSQLIVGKRVLELHDPNLTQTPPADGLSP